MRWLIAFLLLWPLAAQAQTGTATGMTVTSPQGNSKTLGNWMAGWNIIYPTNSSADVTNIQNAVNGAQPVMLAPGTWQVCSQITMPANQRLEGFYTLSNPGSFGPQPANSKTILSCPTNGSFSSGQAFLALKDHDQVRGLDIYCNYGASPTFNNINALNAISVEIDHNNLYWCKEGVSRFSDGSVPGVSSNYSQLAHIHDNLFYGQIDHGIYGDFTNSGFVSDDTYGPNNDFVVIRNAAAIYLNASASNQIVGNRFEDATLAIDLENSGEVNIVGNMCDQIGCIKLNNNNNITVAGNVGHYTNFGGTTDVEFAGSNSVQFAGNNWGDSPIYTVDGGGSLTSGSSIYEQPAGPLATSTLFANSYTQFILQPFMAVNNAALSSTVPSVALLSSQPGNHVSSRGFTPAVSACGTGSPAVSGDDAAGTITTGTGAPTACSLTFAASYSYIPQCTLTTSSTSSVPTISAISATAFTATLSAGLTSGKIYYTCIEQNPNLDPPGAGMLSGWGATNATLSTAAGTDPLGGSTAAKLTVDTNNNRHRTTVAVTGLAGTSTISAYFHAGSSGGFNPVLVSYDSGFANNIGAIFNITDGTFVARVQQAGSGAIVSTGSQSVGSGWVRVWMTFTLGGAAPAWSEIGVAQGSNNFFTGNGTDNLLMWGPAFRTGSLP